MEVSVALPGLFGVCISAAECPAACSRNWPERVVRRRRLPLGVVCRTCVSEWLRARSMIARIVRVELVIECLGL
jgi:hypothetical protein